MNMQMTRKSKRKVIRIEFLKMLNCEEIPTRCPLFVSEQMLNRPKLTSVLSDWTKVLADPGRLAKTLQQTVLSKFRGGR